MNYYLAEINIARMVAPIDSEIMADFVAQLDEVNALAESSPGFIWRLKDDNNNATSFNPFSDDRLIINMSVWKDVESLKHFAYRTNHLEVYLKRDKWFEKMTTPHLAMWWVPHHQFPTPAEGKLRIDHLDKNGPTAFAFTFRKIFDAPKV